MERAAATLYQSYGRHACGDPSVDTKWVKSSAPVTTAQRLVGQKIGGGLPSGEFAKFILRSITVL
ncbi:MAG: hypothetical protein DME65_01830 [Verrucomicrobia bacterium]|nr:MAG: hypothetical protein DME65_01830 [Verrucomicrobiota bacterium]